MKIEIRDNLSHQTTAAQTAASKAVYETHQNYADKLMLGLELATDYRDQRDILISHLERLEKTAQLTIPMDIRPAFFKTANDLVSHLYLSHTDDKTLYQTCFRFLSQINLQIDQAEQTQESASEREWDELQRAVFLLTEWENALLHKKQRASQYAPHLN